MRKSHLIIFLLLCSLTFIVSCKKCITCKAYDRVDNSVTDQQDYCGPRIDVNESKKNYIYIWNNTQTFAECK